MPAADDLFDDDEPIVSEAGPITPTRPFAQYLRETPPAPISQGTRMLLWAAGVMTLLLFLASVLKMAG